MPTSTTYTMSGCLDGTTSASTENDLLALLTDEVNTVDIDIASLDYVSSAGLRIL